MLKIRFAYLIICCLVSSSANGLDVCCKELSARRLTQAAQRSQPFTFYMKPKCTKNLLAGFPAPIPHDTVTSSFLGSQFGHGTFATFEEVSSAYCPHLFPAAQIDMEGRITQYHGLKIRRSTMQWGGSMGFIYSFPKTQGTLFLLPVIGCYNPVLHGLIMPFGRNNMSSLLVDVKAGSFLPIDSEASSAVASYALYKKSAQHKVVFSSGIGLYLPPNCAFLYQTNTQHSQCFDNIAAPVQLVLRKISSRD